MTDHTYLITSRGHGVGLTVHGTSGPVLITYHGGGIIRGSRHDPHAPEYITSNWPGVWIAADYRLLLPSGGREIKEDVEAILDYIVTSLPQADPHKIFVSGFSGGGYPLRLAVAYGAQEAPKPNPRFTIAGWVSYFGMGGDMFLDRWLEPYDQASHTPTKLTGEALLQEQARWREETKQWIDGPEVSESSYTEGLPGYHEERGKIWGMLHIHGSLNDLIAASPGLSAELRKVDHAQRAAQIPEKLRPLFPQIYFAEHPETISPGILVHGDADPVVPYEETLETYETLKPYGKVKLITIPGGDHDLSANGVVVPESIEAEKTVLKWLIDKAGVNPV